MNILFESFSNIGGIFTQIAIVGSNAWFVVLPPVLIMAFELLWMHYVWEKAGRASKSILLEIIPPRDVEKSPQLMETVFESLSGTEKGFPIYEKYALGLTPVKFSLEIASNEGNVHFYIRTPANFRNLVEAHFYAQYPDIEIVEAPDYVEELPKSLPNKDWDVWGTDFVLTRPDAYPIKTYNYFQETVTGKMIDPLAGLIETIGKLGPGQKVWLQYIISPESPQWYDVSGKALVEELARGKKPKPKSPFSVLFFHIGDVIRNVFKGMVGEVAFESPVEETAKDLGPVEFRLTPVEKKVLEAVESNIGKKMFRVRMRFVFVAKREEMDKSFLSSVMGALKQFGDSNLNSLKPYDLSKTSGEYFLPKTRLLYRQRRIYRRYCERDRDPHSNLFLFSTAELATIFHIPDMSVAAPALSRVTAKRGGAPINLPI